MQETMKSLGFSNQEFRKEHEIKELKEQVEMRSAQIANLKQEIQKKVKKMQELDAKSENVIKEKEKEIATLNADLKAS